MPAMPARAPDPEDHEFPEVHTVEDLLALPDDHFRHELADGEHLVSPPPLYAHQGVVGNLYLALGNFLREQRLGVACLGPTGVYFGPRDYLIPDLSVVLREHLDRLRRRGFEGPPDLVIEVLSPSNTTYDLVKKLPRYEAFGVVEYWAVDPATQRVEVYRRPDSGAPYDRPLVLTLAREDVLETPLLPGFRTTLVEVFDPGLQPEDPAGS